ncbi:MAG: CpsD/CapB family tyrosine-protein kinase [Pseudomonadota bacterium]
MEKLQAAIEQARQRRGAAATEKAPAAERPAPKVERKRQAPRLLPNDHMERWDALKSFRLPKTHGDSRRLVAHTASSDAAHFDVLRTKLLIELRKNAWRRVAITSPSTGCGKTTTAANLALSISRQGDLRTVLLDLDLRAPGVSRVFGYQPDEDVTAFLGGTRKFEDVAVTLNGNLAIAMGRTVQTDPTTLIAGDRVGELLSEIDETLAPDVMIFDLPPLLAGDDARSFLRHTDCAILMAQAEKTTAQQVDICEREIAEQTNVMGVVLNRCRFEETRSGAAGYGY